LMLLRPALAAKTFSPTSDQTANRQAQTVSIGGESTNRRLTPTL